MRKPICFLHHIVSWLWFLHVSSAFTVLHQRTNLAGNTVISNNRLLQNNEHHHHHQQQQKRTLRTPLFAFEDRDETGNVLNDNDGRTYDNMGILTPLAEKLDSVTGDWALSYADLSPATPKTPAGISFLLTNVCYALVGISIFSKGDLFYGSLVEIAGVVSFWYHYSQLEYGQNRSEVRLALLTDYFTAGAALITGGVYMVQLGLMGIPMDTLIVATGSIVALSLCWVWEFGYPYLVLHSIWHILSSYTGYLIGKAHIESMM